MERLSYRLLGHLFWFFLTIHLFEFYPAMGAAISLPGSLAFKSILTTVNPTDDPCELFVDQYTHYAGEGTPYPSSSSISFPEGSIVYLSGDFIIDSDVTYKDVAFQAAPGTEILVRGLVSLTLNECVLFSCTGKWNGIRMQSASRITMNFSEIHSAIRGISYDNVFAGVLSIENSSFIDNETGIFLRNPSSHFFHSIVAFSGNNFCGGVHYSSLVGIHVENMPLILPPNLLPNSIMDVVNGIFARNCSAIDISSTHFIRLATGIDYDLGTVNLYDCQFLNIVNAGVQVTRCLGAAIDLCLFSWDKELPIFSTGESTHLGVKINEMASACVVSVTKSTFVADFAGMSLLTARLQYITGFFVNGNNAGEGTSINILGTERRNKFSINAMRSRGIHLSGNFPSTCTIAIKNNTFTMGGTYIDSNLPTSTTHGILCSNGTKHHLTIRENTFNSINAPNDFIYGIELQGSVSLPYANEITLNKFPGSYTNGIRLSSYRNVLVCSNEFTKGRTGIFCSGMGNGTRLQLNKTWLPRLIHISPSGVIGDQFITNSDQSVQTFGNEWHYSMNAGLGLVYSTPQISNQYPNPLINARFIVHTPRSGDPAIPGSSFYPFHPFTIDPEPNVIPWFRYVPFTTVISTCVTLDQRPLQDIDEQIAAGSPDPSIDSASLWEWERYIYDILAAHPEWVGNRPAYATFRHARAGGALNTLYNMENNMQQAHGRQTDLSSNIAAKNDLARNMTSELKQLCYNLASGVSSDTAELRQKEQELTHIFRSIKVLLNQYDALVSESYENISYLSVSAMRPQECYLYTGYRAYLSRYARTDRSLSRDTLDLLLHIAHLCPRTAGSGVYMVRAILADIYPHMIFDDNGEDCFPEPEEPTMQSENRGDDHVQKTAALVYPNPTVYDFSVNIYDISSGYLDITNALGQTVYHQKFEIGTPQLILENRYAPGLYRVLVHYTNGTSQFAHLAILKR